jgi:hypothetical protein
MGFLGRAGEATAMCSLTRSRVEARLHLRGLKCNVMWLVTIEHLRASMETKAYKTVLAESFVSG